MTTGGTQKKGGVSGKRRVRSHIPASMSFRIVVYPCPDSREHCVAHCLELDIIGQDSTIEGAVSELLENIETQYESCQDTAAQFQFPAPPIVWQKYNQARMSRRKLPQELMDRIFDNANRRLGYVTPLPAQRIDRILATRPIFDECLQLSM
ncbi:hypothetical protein ACFL02_01730 [Planctomycetota bacterium]